MRLEEYVSELREIELLTPDEEARLWREWKEQGERASRQKLIRSYQPLVFKCAMPFRELNDVMDIIQEGTVGLIEAAESYDHARGVAFSLFAVHRIRGRMLNFIARERKVDLPTLDAVSAESGLSVKDLLRDETLPVCEQAEIRELTEHMMTALGRLPSKEQHVLTHVYLAGEEAAEVADQLGVTTGYIYRLQKTGIQRIRGMLSRFMRRN